MATEKTVNTTFTLGEFLQNPSGIGSSMFYRRDLITKSFKTKFEKLKRDKSSFFSHKVYDIKTGYLVHITIPSEKYKIKYDVCFEFTLVVGDQPGNILNSYNVKFFSNSPGFTFTYAYTLNKKNLLIDFLKLRINDKALKLPPVVRNPNMVLGFEKSAYLGALYLIDQGLHKKAALDDLKIPFNQREILDNILEDTVKLAEYSRVKKNTPEIKDKSVRNRRKKEFKELESDEKNAKKREKNAANTSEKVSRLNKKVDQRKKKLAKIRSKTKFTSKLKDKNKKLIKK